MTVQLTRPYESTEFIRVRWRANRPLTTQAVAVALVPTSRALTTADWRTSAWETAPAVAVTNESTGEVTYTRHAQLLTGPAATFIPPRGRYGIYARLTDNPEEIIRAPDQCGYLTVT